MYWIVCAKAKFCGERESSAGYWCRCLPVRFLGFIDSGERSRWVCPEFIDGKQKRFGIQEVVLVRLKLLDLLCEFMKLGLYSV